jgi:hypothetical protein
MDDTCIIRRRTGETTDDNTGEITPVWEEIYTGRCRVQHMDRTQASQEQDPGHDFQYHVRVELQIPVSVTDVEVDDEVTFLTAGHDPDLPGSVFIVRDLFSKTHPTSRRLGVLRRTT